MTETHQHHDMDAIALRLILARLEKSKHGLGATLRDLYASSCPQCWRALIDELSSYAAVAFEAIDFDEIEDVTDPYPTMRIDPARAGQAAALVARLLATHLDAK